MKELTIKKIDQKKVGGKVYCSECKCYMPSSVDTAEELKRKLEISKAHEHK